MDTIRDEREAFAKLKTSLMNRGAGISMKFNFIEWVWVFWVVFLITAVLDFSPVLHSFHHADSVLPLIISQERWTPFYWGQSRFGLPIAFLVTPIVSLQIAFFIYYFILIFLSLAAPILCLNLIYPSGGLCLLGVFVMILSWSPRFYFEYLFQPYSSSLSLFFFSLRILASSGASFWVRLLSWTLFLVSVWINIGLAGFGLTFLTAFWLLPNFRTSRVLQIKNLNFKKYLSWKVLLKMLFGDLRFGSWNQKHFLDGYKQAFRDSKNGFVALLLFVLACGINLVGSQNTSHPVAYSVVSLKEWPFLLRNFMAECLLNAPSKGASIVLVIGTLFLSISRVRRELKKYSLEYRLIESLGLAGLCSFLIFSLLDWTAANASSFRYGIQTYFSFLIIFTIILVLLFQRVFPQFWTKNRERLKARNSSNQVFLLKIFRFRSFLFRNSFRSKFLVTTALLGIIIMEYGSPSLDKVNISLNQSLGALSEDAKKAGCTHMIGEYWSVWNTVFYIRYRYPEYPIQGIAARAQDNQKKIQDSLKRHPPRFCARKGDVEMNQLALHWKLKKIVKVNSLGLLDIYEYEGVEEA